MIRAPTLLLVRDLRRVVRTVGATVGRPGRAEVASTAPELAPGAIQRAVRRFHPRRLAVRVLEVRQETPSTRTLRLEAVDGPLPPFSAGQYISVAVRHPAGLSTSRPYSISSNPDDARCWEITVRKQPFGLISTFLTTEVGVGHQLEVSGPEGDFTTCRLRDGDRPLVFVAGGSGITPCAPMIEQLIMTQPAQHLRLVYGSRSDEDIIFRQRVEALAAHPRLAVHLIVAEASASWPGLRGVVDEPTLRRCFAGLDITEARYFVCGPIGMRDSVDAALRQLGVAEHNVRCESYDSGLDITRQRGWPAGLSSGAQVKLTIRGRSGALVTTTGKVLMSTLEQSGVLRPTSCRTGRCSACRTRLVAGRVVMPDHVHLPPSEAEQGIVYPCVAYPVSDVELDLD
jgi:glycine betaine catabolism B